MLTWSPTPRMPRLRRPSALAAPSAWRVEVRPPSLCHAPDGPWQRLMFWLLAPAPQDAAPPLNRLPMVRAAFQAALSDLPHSLADGVRLRIDGARSLRDLWHLRSDVYGVVAVALSQAQAESRLQQLNRHFPTRAPRANAALGTNGANGSQATNGADAISGAHGTTPA